MKYWTAFVNFVFIFIREFVKGLIKLWEFVKAVYYPIYVQTHPTACAVIDWLNGKKTYIVSIAGIAGILWGYHHGTIDLGNLITSLPVLVVAMTIRHGMARQAATAENEVPPIIVVPPCPIPTEYDPHC